MVTHRRDGREHHAVTRDGAATREHLAHLGAEITETSCLTVDEIAVEILKEGLHVAAAQS